MSEDIERAIRRTRMQSVWAMLPVVTLGAVLGYLLRDRVPTPGHDLMLTIFAAAALIEMVGVFPFLRVWMARKATRAYRADRPLVSAAAQPAVAKLPREEQLLFVLSQTALTATSGGSMGPLFGFVGSFLTHTWPPFGAGAAAGLAYWVFMWPTRSWWTRQLAAAGVPLDGVVAVPAAPATTGAAAPDPEGPREPYAPPPL